MSGLGKLTFESVFNGSDTPLKPTLVNAPESPNSKMERTKAELESFLRKTPLMVLEEAAKGTFQQTPTWSSSEIPITVGVEFEMKLVFRGITVKEKASSKKAAKQKAALKYLRQVVNDGKRLDFNIPGETDQEALSYIDQISDRPEDVKKQLPFSAREVDKSIPTANEFPPGESGKNWVGELQERCQKNKLEAPCYEDTKIEASSEFMVTCTMNSQKTRGIRPQKKAAKNLAAWLMMKSLLEGVESVQNFDMSEQFEDMEVNENVAAIRQEVFNMKDKKAALIDLLSDKKRVPEYDMNFKFPSVSTLGLHQILLEVVISQSASADSDDLQLGAEHTQTAEIMKAAAEKEREQKKKMIEVGSKVFCGHGKSEEEAIQSACNSALLHFHTYNYSN